MMLQHNQNRDNINFYKSSDFYYKDIFFVFCSCCILQCYELYEVTAYLPTYLEQVIKLDATTTNYINYLCHGNNDSISINVW